MKMKVAPMTAPEAGKFLRNVAEMTAGNSQNWDNFEAIAADLIKSAYEGGQNVAPPQVDSGREEIARKALLAVKNWAQSKCPCENETPDPCPLCGASVANLEGCKAVDRTFPPRLLEQITLALRPERSGGRE